MSAKAHLFPFPDVTGSIHLGRECANFIRLRVPFIDCHAARSPLANPPSCRLSFRGTLSRLDFRKKGRESALSGVMGTLRALRPARHAAFGEAPPLQENDMNNTATAIREAA